MTTATDIQARLEELWENAEPGPFEADDAIIIRYASGTYAFRPRAGYSDKGDCVRVIERAKPKAPGWEAVAASSIFCSKRDVFAHDPNDDTWYAPAHGWVSPDDLVDPVPLAEMPERKALIEALEAPFIEQGDWAWPGSVPLADALLKLLRDEREA